MVQFPRLNFSVLYHRLSLLFRFSERINAANTCRDSKMYKPGNYPHKLGKKSKRWWIWRRWYRSPEKTISHQADAV
jgi:hypothetical protein